MIPKIYAHRGASSDFPEHTRAAYLAAIDQGADGFECDVRLTKDGVPVLWHDSSMERIAGSKELVAAISFQEMKKVYPAVMQLEELIELAINHKKELAIETKHPVPQGKEIETVVSSLISNVDVKCAIISFSWLALEKVPKDIESVLLLRPPFISLRSKFTSAKGLGPNIAMLKKRGDFVTSAKSQGKKIYVWTVDSVEDLEFCALNQVDVIITNKPSLARKVLGYP